MTGSNVQRIIITGRPGSGKTTLVRKVAEQLGSSAGGFYTEEVRVAGRREGFDLITMDGRRGRMASTRIRGPHRVSKYGVDVAAVDDIGVAAIRKAIAEAEVIVIDEIGKMELFSQQFRDAVTEALDSGKPVLASIMRGSHPFGDEIKRRSDVRLYELSEQNRDELRDRVTKELRQLLQR